MSWVQSGSCVVGVGRVTEPAGEAEVDEFDLAAGLVHTHDVLRFEVQVDDALLVDEVDAVDDLQHVFDHLPLCQLKVLVDDPLKQLTARDPADGEGCSSLRGR